MFGFEYIELILKNIVVGSRQPPVGGDFVKFAY